MDFIKSIVFVVLFISLGTSFAQTEATVHDSIFDKDTPSFDLSAINLFNDTIN